MVSGLGSEVDVDANEAAEIRTQSDALEQCLAGLRGGDADRGVNGRLSRLSETERQIVFLVRAGHANDEIARRLFLSAKTVEWSRTKIHRKLRAVEATCDDARVAAPDPSALLSAASKACGIDPNEERT
jgi:DNA-binding CsgD family transcriptional regulator